MKMRTGRSDFASDNLILNPFHPHFSLVKFPTHMKTLPVLLPVFLATSTVLSAQTPTIQVTVSDTIEVPASHISVIISFKNTEAEYSNHAPDFTASRAEVTGLLDQYHVAWKNASDQLGFLGGIGGLGKGADDIFADFNSAEQLEKVLPLVRLVKYVDAMETGCSVDKDALDLTRLYDKLFKKARAKADMMARLSGKKVGGVYQIGSPFDAFNPADAMESSMKGLGAYGDMMKAMFGNMFGEKRPDHKVPVTENLTVTYYLLD